MRFVLAHCQRAYLMMAFCWQSPEVVRHMARDRELLYAHVFWSRPLLIKPAGLNHGGSTWRYYLILTISQRSHPLNISMGIKFHHLYPDTLWPHPNHSKFLKKKLYFFPSLNIAVDKNSPYPQLWLWYKQDTVKKACGLTLEIRAASPHCCLWSRASYTQTLQY
jgi:hypothetical protein